MKWILVVTLGWATQSFAASIDIDWMQGHWTGCETTWLHDKNISSALGGTVIGANKVLQGDTILLRDFFEIVPFTDSSNSATITFYTGTAIEEVAQCTVSGLAMACQTADGSYAITATLIKGPSPDQDVLNMVRTWQGTTHNFNLQRGGKTIPSCT